MNATETGFAYDAVALFGFGELTTEPLPQPSPGEIVIRYSGWSLQELRDSEIGRKFLHEQDWYNKYPWSTEKLPSCIYRLRVPVRDSNNKTFGEQERLLPQGEQVAPVVLVASALLSHHLQTKEDLLKNDWTRCKEQDADGDRVGLGWRGGRLGVGNFWDGVRVDYVRLSSVRTS
jgi:hypothetical protein